MNIFIDVVSQLFVGELDIVRMKRGLNILISPEFRERDDNEVE